MRSVSEVDAWMRDPENRNRHQGDGWHNRCEQFVNNSGDFDESFDTAYLAAKASGPLTRNTKDIPDGAIGYWRGVWIDGEECGHTAIMFRGRWMMASDAVTEMVGNGTGTITPGEYAIRRPAAIWLGWTMRHGTQTLATSSTAGLDNETISNVPEKRRRRRMLSIVPLTDGHIYLESQLTGKRVKVGSVYHVQIIQRVLDNNSDDTMLPDELQIFEGYAHAVSITDDAQTAAILNGLSTIRPVVDSTALKAAINSALAGAKLPLAAEQVQQIAKAVNDETLRRLAN